jgi:hypothetical protein
LRKNKEWFLLGTASLSALGSGWHLRPLECR